MNNKKTHKNVHIKIIAPMVILLALLGYYFWQNSSYTTINEFESYNIGMHDGNKDSVNPILLKTYNEYKIFISNYKLRDLLKEQKFEENDYIVYFSVDSSCLGKKEPLSIKIDAKNIIIKMDAKDSSGYCAAKVYAYLIPVKNNKLNAILPISTEDIN